MKPCQNETIRNAYPLDLEVGLSRYSWTRFLTQSNFIRIETHQTYQKNQKTLFAHLGNETTEGIIVGQVNGSLDN